MFSPVFVQSTKIELETRLAVASSKYLYRMNRKSKLPLRIRDEQLIIVVN